MKKILLILLIGISISIQSQSLRLLHQLAQQQTSAPPPVYAGAVYEDTGGISSGTNASVDVIYPSTVNANDILFISVMDADNDTFTVPSGFTLIRQSSTNTNLSVALFWKRAIGTETGTITVTSALADGQVVGGIMYRYTGCVTSGTPYEQFSLGSVQQTTSNTHNNTLNTNGIDRLAVNLVTVEDNTINGATLNGWIEDSRESSTAGSDFSFSMATQEIPTSGTNAGTIIISFSASEYNASNNLYLIPD